MWISVYGIFKRLTPFHRRFHRTRRNIDVTRRNIDRTVFPHVFYILLKTYSLLQRFLFLVNSCLCARRPGSPAVPRRPRGALGGSPPAPRRPRGALGGSPAVLRRPRGADQPTKQIGPLASWLVLGVGCVSHAPNQTTRLDLWLLGWFNLPTCF
jgi:hypothetical protein